MFASRFVLCKYINIRELGILSHTLLRLSYGLKVKMYHKTRGFHSFHKIDWSDISANVVYICLCVNIMLL